LSYCLEIDQTRPTRAEISIPTLLNNFRIVRSLLKPDVKIIAMVKANAYGHGILRISRELIDFGVNCLGVAYLEEAVYLRKSGITAPILVMGAVNSWQISEYINYDIEITSSSLSKSQAISETAVKMGKNAVVHLKIDTGMGRIGVQWHNAENFIRTSMSLPGLEIKGLCSHFAKSDCDPEFTALQINRFNQIIETLKSENICPPMLHIANSAGIINYPESHFNTVRPGLMLYGYNPNGYLPEIIFGERKLIPAMTLKTTVSYFKVLPEESGISYNHNYITKTQSRIATLPVGYGDGYSRLLSNGGKVIIRGVEYPVAGNICMDQMMIDLGADGTAYNGDEVLLFGENDYGNLPLERLSSLAQTITYELLCQISYRVPRIYLTN